jgi:hypothetical protein
MRSGASRRWNHVEGRVLILEPVQLPIFSSPLVTGAMATLIDGVGNNVDRITAPLALSASVSHTLVITSFTSAPMSPA